MIDTPLSPRHVQGTRDAELVEQRARTAGVKRIATVGMDDASIERAVAPAHEHEEVVAIVGRHPNEAEGFQPHDIEPIERAAADPRVRAIGETGLDYFRDYAPREDQRRAFEAQMDLAKRLRLPLVIHTRAAEDDTFAVLREQAEGLTVIMHCFSAPGRARRVRRARLAVLVRRQRDLSEGHATCRPPPARSRTSCCWSRRIRPYLSPQPVRGKPNEPANVVETAAFVAELRGVPYDELEATVERNAARVFGW